MTDTSLDETAEESAPRRARWPRRLFIGSALLGGAGWWVAGWIQDARRAAQRSTDK